MAHESRHCLDEFIDVLKRSFSTPEEAYQYFSDGAIGFSREMFALRLKTLDDAGYVNNNKDILWSAICREAGIDPSGLMDSVRWARVVLNTPTLPCRRLGRAVKYVAASVLTEAALECTRAVAQEAMEGLEMASVSPNEMPR
ncbi:hypothetical protein Pmar_PMAR004343 [Perkinsus marinus ATCC 50983]|uniref:Uncharacterized protein n=1 Tax=Perkinsus marinus (strain ATCC 50983 / TXsc) TaxID=423536 RepID=C5L1V5_PERM5|nr:hypothetical protein Pmar_PMAR004343 [Perkinsus marinus ATCC 50983]EER09288.1 hypothetical protein Pmar_PMAR004343 [Perkinsus marinus ATCC 50983]|eukprot:XP_002777472.1 hypothetical protein Pmar_PMAR004343 [Perkinsus marinus ATCC 50983]